MMQYEQYFDQEMVMKKLLAMCVLALVSTAALADELSEGVKAWEARDFARAQQVFSKLAQAGNPEAQLMLGEMYGFGEGVPEDPALAERWLSQAQANGNKDAAESRANVRQRGARKADIARYVAGGDAGDVTLAKAGCTQPVIADVTLSAAEIKATDAKIKEWRACYDRFAARLAAQLPAGKAIPADVAKLMNLTELERARAAMDKAYAAAAADAASQVKAFTAANDAWYARVQKYASSVEEQQKNEDQLRNKMIGFRPASGSVPVSIGKK